jgi:hypothetical protein
VWLAAGHILPIDLERSSKLPHALCVPLWRRKVKDEGLPWRDLLIRRCAEQERFDNVDLHLGKKHITSETRFKQSVCGRIGIMTSPASSNRHAVN